MITLTNYESGEMVVEKEGGPSIRLTRDQANRLILHARMHTVAEFVEQLPALIVSSEAVQFLRDSFAKLETSTDRWNFKEKFARLQTLTKDYEPPHPEQVVDSTKFN